jgi:hypothetical protein
MSNEEAGQLAPAPDHPAGHQRMCIQSSRPELQPRRLQKYLKSTINNNRKLARNFTFICKFIKNYQYKSDI